MLFKCALALKPGSTQSLIFKPFAAVSLHVQHVERKDLCSLLQPATRSTLITGQRDAVERTYAVVVGPAASWPCGKLKNPPPQGRPAEIGERSREKWRFAVLLFNAARSI